MLIEITISSNIKKIIAGLSPENEKAAFKAGMTNLLLEAKAKAVPLTPVRTSNLVNSERIIVSPDGTKGILRATAKHAKFVHDGTGLYGPHHKKIVPVNKKALFWPGAEHPVTSVKGIRPNPFFTKALKQINPGKVFEEGMSNFLLRRLR